MTGYIIFDGKGKDTTDASLNISGAYKTAKFANDEQIPLMIKDLYASNVSVGGIVTSSTKSSNDYVVEVGSDTLTIASDDDITVS